MTHITYFVTIEHTPMPTMIMLPKWHNIYVIYKIHKCVTPIAFILEINWKVKKVNLLTIVAIFSQLIQHHLLCVLVGNISNHE